jgi:hypothetical protein
MDTTLLSITWINQAEEEVELGTLLDPIPPYKMISPPMPIIPAR